MKNLKKKIFLVSFITIFNWILQLYTILEESSFERFARWSVKKREKAAEVLGRSRTIDSLPLIPQIEFVYRHFRIVLRQKKLRITNALASHRPRSNFR